ncbi:hypothetical protein [Pseudomonas maioricensis]|uniref:hypothetical protein n=1 Tax=Pseudomonas maioricensis TaxID=1766623 RepID=UPI001FAE5E41|nr:hypothetical protein [Pseudomonas sp. S25]
MAFIVTCVVSLVFWTVVSVITGAKEPWDLASYWTIIYPAALALSVILGAVLKSSQWSAGGVVMLSQIPVVLAISGTSSPLLGVGIIYAAFLSIPAITLSWLAGKLCSGKKGGWASTKK